MEPTNLPLTLWFFAFYLMGPLKTEISALELSCHLGIAYNTSWLLHNKILRAMTEREEVYVLREKIQIMASGIREAVDTFLGGGRLGDNGGREFDNKVPIYASSSLNEADHSIHAKTVLDAGFRSHAIAQGASQHMVNCNSVLSDGLVCIRSVVEAGCSHEAVVIGCRHPNELAQSRWINVLLGNLKITFSGTFHASIFDNYDKRYLFCFCYRFNRLFEMYAMTEKLARKDCCYTLCSEPAFSVFEVYG